MFAKAPPAFGEIRILCLATFVEPPSTVGPRENDCYFDVFSQAHCEQLLDGTFSKPEATQKFVPIVDTPGLPQLRLAGHRAEVAVLAWDTFHPARLATCGDDNRVLLWDAAGAEEEGSSMQDCTRAEVFAAPESAETRAGASPSLARFLPPHYPACSARTPTRTSSSMADWFTPPTKRRLTSVTSTTPGSLDHSTCSEGVVTLPDGKSLSPPAEAVLSPRKKVDNAANLPQRRLLPCLNALEDDIKKDAGATGLTTCDLENQPLQMQETPPRPVASEVMPSPPSASHSRKQHKIMTRLFKKQAASAVDKEMDDGNGKRERKTITIKQEAAMLKAVESGVKKKKVAEDFGVALSTVPRASSTIANCFRHASFGVNSGGDSEDIGAAANEGAAGDQDLASWDALLDAGVVPDCDTFCTYVSADADAVTTGELTVTGVVNDDSDECVDDSPELVNPMFRRPRKRWMRQTRCAASSALTMTARTDST
ncbi:hypothetical protein HPB52_012443 [Rhipicephalus sanguineus]|uniref:Uncharacterized protein n=1 Tax=Rhipicephalus sanguineus TaxID=34632 RepID=A0A9D4QAT0_RHISA|nr:hypothetical protein HPB52_012443 [Rhipicephalus sanguineus]